MPNEHDKAIAEIAQVQPEIEEEIMARPNVVGHAVGFKVTEGRVTDEPAMLVLVTRKVAEEALPEPDRVPRDLRGHTTDVLEVGVIYAGGQPSEAGAQSLVGRRRPAQGGDSVGHVDITAGTFATAVYGRGDFPGIPSRYYILSNNHVLANSNDASPGDPILQPGPYDGGTLADRIGSLSRFVPIQFDPPIPRSLQDNVVDAAIAEADFEDINREVYWIGHMRGWLSKSGASLGMQVQKTGRTTNYTTGQILAVNATVNVNYGGGRVARFRDQIITSNMSAPGDSGSLVSTLDNVAVGLLFAGSDRVTIINHIENVQDLLGIVVAEERV